MKKDKPAALNGRLLDRVRPTNFRGAAAIMVALAVVGLLAGFLVNLVQGPQWTATTSVLLRFPSPQALALTGNAESVDLNDQVDAASLATSQDVLAKAAEKLNLPGGVAQLQRDVSAGAQGSSRVVVISATQSDPVLAQRTTDAVADAYVAMTQQWLTDLLTAAAPAPGAPAATDGDIVNRANLLSRGAPPVLVFHQLPPSRPSWLRTPSALAILGLAAGALTILALNLLSHRIDRPGDAQRLLSLPAVPYERSGTSAAAERLAHGLLRERSGNTLLVCPVDIEAEMAAVRFVGWLRGQPTGSDSPEVRLVPEPTAAVITARPEGDETAGLLLVVPRGTARPVLTEAATLLATWCPVDAVVLAD